MGAESGAVQEQRLFAIEDEAAATTPSPPTTTATSSGQQQSTGEAERRTEARTVEIDFSDHPEVRGCVGAAEEEGVWKGGGG